MSILDMNFDNVVEPRAIQNVNEEHQLRIVEIEAKTSNSGKPMVAVRFESVEDPYAKDINHYIMLPTEDDDAKKRNSKLVSLQHFYEGLGVNYKSGPVNLDDLVGSTCWAILALEESDQYGSQNRIKRFVAGH